MKHNSEKENKANISQRRSNKLTNTTHPWS